jgi:transposase
MRTVYQLKPKELAEIEQAMRQDKRAEVRQRAMAIRLLHLGQKPSEVAEQQLVSVPTIYNWHKLWREQGIEGLANKPKPGRRAKATEAYCQKLEEMLDKEPAAYGYRFAIWTTDRLRAHLEKETGILLSESRFRAPSSSSSSARSSPRSPPPSCCGSFPRIPSTGCPPSA